MTNVLFVCLGNICRSPLAEALFNHHVTRMGLTVHYRADSCGTANYHVGDPPDHRTIRNAEQNGVIIRHRGRQFHPLDFEGFDHILPMDQSNYSNIARMDESGKWLSKVRLMRTFDPTPDELSVPDPYYGNEKDFQKVFDILNRSTLELIRFLEDTRGSGGDRSVL